jgi:maleate isomerase
MSPATSALRQPASAPLAVNLTHMPHELDAGLGARLRVGMITLATDQTSEAESRRIFDLPGVDHYVGRIFNDARISADTLRAMERDIEGVTRLILPGSRLDAVGFSCTSGAMVIGEDKVFSLIRKVRPDIACSSPITGAVAGMQALGLKRIALLTPYVQAINDMMREFLETRGFEVPVMGSFNNDNDEEVARISRGSAVAAATELARSPHVDAIFMSCTSIRSLDVIPEVEAETGKPMIASNPALAWHLLRLGGIRDPQPQFGRLFTV